MNIETLRTIHNYAKMEGVSLSAIYKRISTGKLTPVVIDGMKFVDLNVYPIIEHIKTNYSL